ncbi:hypothetical protein BGZ60DRAFT_533279 [Tricladium varicosporioides]|nr:hypothetical protein BGZ60DRAFT_533279 [Hymenoscyphus varicosporioides]
MSSKYELLDEDSSHDEVQHYEKDRGNWQALSYNTSHYCFLLIGFVLGLVVCFIGYSLTLWQVNGNCTRRASVWSPALDIYDGQQFSLQRFNGALRDPNNFRGPPSDEIDKAWEGIILPHKSLFRLSKDELIRLNVSEYAAEYTEEMGGGYIAGLEVFHELHCVNMLRKATYMDYYLPKMTEWRDRDTLRFHLDHCVDMLRQKLTCNPDLGMTTYVWAKGWKQAFPNFNTLHKCLPYDKVLDWARSHSVHGIGVADLTRKPGALELDARP